jgi:hypothetical protein
MITYIDLYRVLYPTAMPGDCVFTFFHMCRFVLYVSLQQIGKLNWRAKFQTVNRCRSLSFTLHVPSKYSVSTPLWRNRLQFHTRACFYLFDWPEISVWYFNWQVKLTCKVSDSKSMSKVVFYTTCTVKIQCFHTPMTKSTPISHIAYFYMFDWPEISVWYFNWQVKLTCKVSDSKSMSKFVFYTTCTVKIQCFYTPMTKSTPISHTRILLFVRLTWNFSMILQLAS